MLSKRYFRHTLQQAYVTENVDQVVAACPIPDEGTVNNVRGEVHVIGQEEHTVIRGAMYGFDGFILPVHDPDQVDSYQTLWDEQVPKEAGDGAAGFDLDTQTAVTSSHFEPGVSDTEALIDVNNLTQVYSRRKLITFASRPAGFEAIGSAGDVNLYTPTDAFMVKTGRKYRVAVPSVLVFAFSNPALNTTQSTAGPIPTEDEWVFLKYIDMFLEDAWVDMMGRHEAGAESPYEDLHNFVNDLLEPTVVQETGGSFNAMAWYVFARFTFDMSVPGRLPSGTALSAN